jgi:mannose-6-phosphate isomerase-like protein (cupin superfamily)
MTRRVRTAFAARSAAGETACQATGSWIRLAAGACCLLAVVMGAPSGVSAQLDPKAVLVTKPEDLKWVKNAAGTQETAVLFGDPTKAGEPYVIRLRWLPGNMSQPHSHPNDRFFVVISGTWWLGSGSKFEPEKTVGVKAGTYVFHKAGEMHYDGAKGEVAEIMVWGMGPANFPNRK